MTAQKKKKKSSRKKKKSKIPFKENVTKESDNQKNFCPNLINLQTVQSFYFGERDLYSCTCYFLSVRSNLFASKYISRELTQMKKLWLLAQ